MVSPTLVRINVEGNVPGGSLLPPLGTPWDPAQLGASLLGHWDASDEAAFNEVGGGVQTWSSKSGSLVWEVPAGYARPVRQPNAWGTDSAGVYFSGDASSAAAGAMMQLVGPVLPAITLFVTGIRHLQSNDTQISSRVLVIVPVGSGAIAQAAFLRPSNDASQNQLQIAGVGAGSSGAQLLTPWGVNEKAIAMVQFQTAALSARLNAGSSSGNATPGATTSTRWYLGGHFANPKAAHFTAKEIIAVSGLMSTSDRQKMEGFLAWTDGIQSELPDNHPYKNDGPYI